MVVDVEALHHGHGATLVYMHRTGIAPASVEYKASPLLVTWRTFGTARLRMTFVHSKTEVRDKSSSSSSSSSSGSSSPSSVREP